MEENKRTMSDRRVELHSEEMQQVMGKMPSWIVRWGATLFFAIILLLLIMSWFFKYPDVITSSIVLTSAEQPVAHVVARSSGRITNFFVTEGQQVKKGEILVILENPAKEEDVFLVKTWLMENGHSMDSISANIIKKELTLGEIQSFYSSYLKSVYDYENYNSLNYYPQKIESAEIQLSGYQNHYNTLINQREIIEEQYIITKQQFERDSALFLSGTISKSDYELSKKSLLQSALSLENANASVTNLTIQIGSINDNIIDLKHQKSEREINIHQSLKVAEEQLMNSISSWEMNYCLRSPIDGDVTFVNYWSENQVVTAGDPVFSVIPYEGKDLLGISMLPPARSGKVKEGQRVIIRFSNYPDQEFGIVNGVVNSISLVPAGNQYRVEVKLPDGLMTNYKIELPFSYELQGQAEIVTEDLRLIERFVMPIKRLIKESL